MHLHGGTGERLVLCGNLYHPTASCVEDDDLTGKGRGLSNGSVPSPDFRNPGHPPTPQWDYLCEVHLEHV